MYLIDSFLWPNGRTKKGINTYDLQNLISCASLKKETHMLKRGGAP